MTNRKIDYLECLYTKEVEVEFGIISYSSVYKKGNRWAFPIAKSGVIVIGQNFTRFYVGECHEGFQPFNFFNLAEGFEH